MTAPSDKNLPIPSSDETTEAVTRNNLGQFVKGVSGNLHGKPIGSKNRTTLMKQAMEEALTRELADDFLDILETALTLAKQGDKDMIKMVLGDFLKENRRAPPVEDDKIDLSKIHVEITQYFGPDGEKPVETAIEAEFEEIKAKTGLNKD
jgi:hypothetical protein